MQVFCINRNIVECKDVSGKSCLMLLSRINRNIVECKVYTASGAVSPAARINRNIVECKVFKAFPGEFSSFWY